MRKKTQLFWRELAEAFGTIMYIMLGVLLMFGGSVVLFAMKLYNITYIGCALVAGAMIVGGMFFIFDHSTASKIY